jgi:NAD(P)-dependent dehydrogenase (short-subunit alcohol dehydrogenase family)
VKQTPLEWGLAGKTILVTGASSGVGAATSRALRSIGASVVLTGRDATRLAQEAEAVVKAGGTSTVLTADISDPDEAVGVITRTIETRGTLHGVVHAASIVDPRSIDDTTFECIERQWLANVVAPILMTRAAIPHLLPGSSIVFVGSTAALVGYAGSSAYSATKGAITTFSRVAAIELAPKGIRVNTVAPGNIRTPMLQPHLDSDPTYEPWILERTPLGRIAEPEEIAAAIIFTLSNVGSILHGSTLVADAGWTAQ